MGVDLKVKVTPVVTYEIEIDGAKHSGFRKESEWEGMTKFSGDGGIVIVNNLTGFEDFLRKLTEDDAPFEGG